MADPDVLAVAVDETLAWSAFVGYTSGLILLATIAVGCIAAPSGDSGWVNYLPSCLLLLLFVVDVTAAELIHGDWAYTLDLLNDSVDVTILMAVWGGLAATLVPVADCIESSPPVSGDSSCVGWTFVALAHADSFTVSWGP